MEDGQKADAHQWSGFPERAEQLARLPVAFNEDVVFFGGDLKVHYPTIRDRRGREVRPPLDTLLDAFRRNLSKYRIVWPSWKARPHVHVRARPLNDMLRDSATPPAVRAMLYSYLRTWMCSHPDEVREILTHLDRYPVAVAGTILQLALRFDEFAESAAQALARIVRHSKIRKYVRGAQRAFRERLGWIPWWWRGRPVLDVSVLDVPSTGVDGPSFSDAEMDLIAHLIQVVRSGKWRSARNLSGYLFKSAWNHLVNRRKEAETGRHPALVSVPVGDEDEDLEATDKLLSFLAAAKDRAEEYKDEIMRDKIIGKVDLERRLAPLAPQDRRLAKLVSNNRPQTEIARALGKSTTWVSRGIRRLGSHPSVKCLAAEHGYLTDQGEEK